MYRFIALMTLVSAISFAAPVKGPVIQKLDEISESLVFIRQSINAIPVFNRKLVSTRLNNLSARAEQLADDIDALSGYQEGWYPTNGQSCQAVCSAQRLTSSRSPEGAECVSGENKAPSAEGTISYVHGCWPNCNPYLFGQTTSYGAFCYAPNQKRDNDRTDITVGCFCKN